ncbi:MAG: ribosome small subunit-dependent GTPase A [Bacteroidales bacterium]|nr:ribosome small subunit-dependent GTPase A [Bacteroidales bacterium]
MTGLVIKNTGSWYMVKLDQEDGLGNQAQPLLPCKVKGNFRLKGIRTTNPIAVGDHVTVVPNNDGSAFITQIAERSNYIIRRASNLSKQAHILASNLDNVILIATVAHPITSTKFIDRFLATAEAYRVPATLVINKKDLYNADEMRYAEDLAYLYRYIGYDVHMLSVETGEGMKEIRELLRGKTTLLSGHSGVGKSSFINAILPNRNIKTAELSDVHDQGIHTTTFSEMYELPEGGYIIDTPGIKGFGTIEFSKEETSHYFREIFKISKDCRFGNCTHTHEPGCAVQAALESHLISQSRYESYLSILEDETEGKYRE